VRSPMRYQFLTFAALLFWLTLGWMGAHRHFCFDGQEPLVAIHVDHLGEHHGHSESDGHRDADLPLTEPILAKLLKIDLLFLFSVVLILALLVFKAAIVVAFCLPLYIQRYFGLLPPLRGPPAFPA
jgi:hypothetical protein